MRSGAFYRNAALRETLLLCLSRDLAADSGHAEWVLKPSLGIISPTWLLWPNYSSSLCVNQVYSMQVVNVLTRDCVVMAVALLSRLKIDFSYMIIVEIHERAFKSTTTYPFPYLIFHMYRDSRVHVLHCDKLI